MVTPLGFPQQRLTAGRKFNARQCTYYVNGQLSPHMTISSEQEFQGVEIVDEHTVLIELY